MEIFEQQQNDAWIFRIDGRLDSNTAPDLETTVFRAIEQGARHMVMDFEALAYISSAGLRVILKTAKDLKRREGNLILCFDAAGERDGHAGFVSLDRHCSDRTGLGGGCFAFRLAPRHH